MIVRSGSQNFDSGPDFFNGQVRIGTILWAGNIEIQTIERKLIERLEFKSKRLSQILEFRKNDLEAILYNLLAKYFGFKVNAVPFELLASSIEFNLIRKHRNNGDQLLALFFGQAGFLQEEFKGSFPKRLKKEYLFLTNK